MCNGLRCSARDPLTPDPLPTGEGESASLARSFFYEIPSPLTLSPRERGGGIPTGEGGWASPDFADTLQEVDNAEIGGQEMSTKRRKFTDEYKAEAVRIWRESGKSVRRVAVELGLTPSALERWVKQEKDAQQLGTTRASLKAEREELLRLRRENELLRQERDFLRSAAAYFAKERK